MNGGDPKSIPPEYKIARKAFDDTTHSIVFKQQKIGVFKI